MVAVSEAWRTRPADPAIGALVDALGGVPGVTTRASCAGHLYRDTAGCLALGSAPYIAFTAPFRFACRLGQAVYYAGIGAQRLRYAWSLIGWFTPEGEFLFRLSARRPSFLAWRRSWFDSDFARLSQIVLDMGGTISMSDNGEADQ